MSGHSKWSTIKRQKEATDIARGKLFSKLSRAISIAIKTGGGNDPSTNHRLRIAIDSAKSANMPKANIERALSKGSSEVAFEEVTYEGFGPSGIGILVEVATDNRNRSGQEIKAQFERGGGRFAGPGAVSFDFLLRGLLLVKKTKDTEAQMLELIDKGVEDIEETPDAIEAYVEPSKLSSTKEELEKSGFEVISAELVQKPKTLHKIEEEETARKALTFLEKIEDLDDVQKVYANLDIPDDILEKLQTS